MSHDSLSGPGRAASVFQAGGPSASTGGKGSGRASPVRTVDHLLTDVVGDIGRFPGPKAPPTRTAPRLTGEAPKSRWRGPGGLATNLSNNYCLVLELGRLRLQEIPDGTRAAGILFSSRRAAASPFAAAFLVSPGADPGTRQLEIRSAAHVGYQIKAVEVTIPLVTTAAFERGVRTWLSCPSRVDGAECERRVMKLYLPPGERTFACKECHRLQYVRGSSGRFTRDREPLRIEPIASLMVMTVATVGEPGSVYAWA